MADASTRRRVPDAELDAVAQRVLKEADCEECLAAASRDGHGTETGPREDRPGR